MLTFRTIIFEGFRLLTVLEVVIAKMSKNHIFWIRPHNSEHCCNLKKSISWHILSRRETPYAIHICCFGSLAGIICFPYWVTIYVHVYVPYIWPGALNTESPKRTFPQISKKQFGHEIYVFLRICTMFCTSEAVTISNGSRIFLCPLGPQNALKTKIYFWHFFQTLFVNSL